MELSEIKTYEAAVSYCLSVPRFTKKNSIEDTRAFYAFLNCPGEGAKIIHVAGTNGKGSVCAFLQSIFLQAGKRVGMFTSPHLCDIRERIRYNGELLSKEAFLKSFFCLRTALYEYRRQDIRQQEYHPSFFEMLFFIGMLYYEETKPEYLLLETGLGGCLDATNVILSPALCIITKIGFDHMEYLGDTLAAIAGQKAGILKKGVPVVYWKERAAADAVLEEKAKNLSCPCFAVSKDGVNLNSFANNYIDFSFESRYYGNVRFTVESKAVYQTENAALAVTAAEYLLGKDMLDPIQKGIASMHWAGRMEEVLPNVFLDGAHNVDGIDAFLLSAAGDVCKGKRRLLFSVVQDKQYQAMVDMIVNSGVFERIYLAPIQNDRSASKEDLVEALDGRIAAESFDTPQEAFEKMLADKETEDYLYAAGSLYLIGQLKEYCAAKSLFCST